MGGKGREGKGMRKGGSEMQMNPFICISLPFIFISLPKEHERRNGRGEREQSKGDGGWGSCQRVWACTHTRLHRRLCPAVRDARACACALMVRASARACVCLVRHTHGLSHFPLRKGHHLPPPDHPSLTPHGRPHGNRHARISCHASAGRSDLKRLSALLPSHSLRRLAQPLAGRQKPGQRVQPADRRIGWPAGPYMPENRQTGPRTYLAGLICF